jgi:hydrogenase expression/formation protein HypC
MCIASPGKIVRINGNKAEVDFNGAQKEIDISLLPEKAKDGDEVLVHAGFAIQFLRP